LQKFLDLALSLEPENLTCDGELPQSEVRRKYNRLTKEWKKLEKQVGRTVTEQEVWEASFPRYYKEDKISTLLTAQVMRGD
tara:strand:+ start:753 stop:995 length:243 start_codon:yes stop_codon:yes gene_type:complete